MNHFSSSSLRFGWLLFSVLVVYAWAANCNELIAQVIRPAKPNIVLINLDDADVDLFSETNLASGFANFRRLAREGLQFTNLHATTPLCGPSRACLYRGQYAHNTGILVNEPADRLAGGLPGGLRRYRDQGFFDSDLSTWMQDAGYRTMMVGKFLHGDFVPVLPRGWDDFHSFMGARYYDFFTLSNERPGGWWRRSAAGEYRTVSETERAVQLLRDHSARGSSQPFFLNLNPLGPHAESGDGGMIDLRYASFKNFEVAPRSINFNEFDFSDKGGQFKNLRLFPIGWEHFVDSHYRDRLRATMSLDDQLGAIMQQLVDMGAMDNTYIIVTSDNGFSLGQNRTYGKGHHFDHATRVPLFVFGPNIDPGTADHLLAHIDLAPTIVDLAGGVVPEFVDGISFAPLLETPELVPATDWRKALLIENWESRIMFGKTLISATNAVRHYDSVFVEHANGDREYYDLATDPLQIDNTYNSLSFSRRTELESELRSLKSDHRPRVGIGSPAIDGAVVQGGAQLSGIADASQGISAVRVAIQDQATGEYWDGQQWIAGFRQIETKVGNRAGVVGRWSYGFEPSVDQLPLGAVRVWVWSYDTAGGFSQSSTRLFELELAGPESTIETPIPGARMTGVVNCQGTAFSTGQTTHVRFIIRRVSDGRFWNGDDFQVGWSYSRVPVAQDGSWIKSLDMESGVYFVTTYGVDEDGLIEQTPTIHRFSVE